MVKTELYHHGIFGMKWGRRNGPPYPLDAEDHSTAEKKAGWRKSLDSNRDSVKKTGVNKRREAHAAEKAKSNSGLDKKKVLKGVAITAGLIGSAYVGYRVYNSIKNGQASNTIDAGKALSDLYANTPSITSSFESVTKDITNDWPMTYDDSNNHVLSRTVTMTVTRGRNSISEGSEIASDILDRIVDSSNALSDAVAKQTESFATDVFNELDDVTAEMFKKMME